METLQGNLFRPPTLTREEKIIHLVCTRFKVDRTDLIRHGNQPRLSDPRRLCWWLLDRHTGLTQDHIAYHFDCRNRSTISHGISYIANLPRHYPLVKDRDELDFKCKFLK